MSTAINTTMSTNLITSRHHRQQQHPLSSQNSAAAATTLVSRAAEHLGGNEDVARMLAAGDYRVARSLLGIGVANEVKRLRAALKDARSAAAAAERVLSAKSDIPDWQERAKKTRVWQDLYQAALEEIRADEAELSRLEQEVAACLPTA